MSTTTITPEVIMASESSHFTALLRSYWYKTKAALAPLFTTAKAYAAAALAWIPTPIVALATPVALTTRWGYGLLGKGIGFAVNLVGKAISMVARFVHQGLNWLGDRVCDLIGIFSETGAAKTGDLFAMLGGLRLTVAHVVASHAVNTKDVIAGAFNTGTTRGAVAITSAAVAGTIAFNALAPSAFTSLLVSLPASSASSLATVAVGGWMALAPIAMVGLVAMAAKLIVPLFKRTKKVEELETVTGDESAPIVMKTAPAKAEVVEGTVLTKDEVQTALETEQHKAEAEWKGDINKPSATKPNSKKRNR